MGQSAEFRQQFRIKRSLIMNGIIIKQPELNLTASKARNMDYQGGIELAIKDLRN